MNSQNILSELNQISIFYRSSQAICKFKASGYANKFGIDGRHGNLTLNSEDLYGPQHMFEKINDADRKQYHYQCHHN